MQRPLRQVLYGCQADRALRVWPVAAAQTTTTTAVALARTASKTSGGRSSILDAHRAQKGRRHRKREKTND